MSNAYLFGLSTGHLPKYFNNIARKYGAHLVNHTDPQCNCGYGCAPYTCPNSKRHWFEAENKGEPFNSSLSLNIKTELEKHGLKWELVC